MDNMWRQFPLLLGLGLVFLGLVLLRLNVAVPFLGGIGFGVMALWLFLQADGKLLRRVVVSTVGLGFCVACGIALGEIFFARAEFPQIIGAIMGLSLGVAAAAVPIVHPRPLDKVEEGFPLLLLLGLSFMMGGFFWLFQWTQADVNGWFLNALGIFFLCSYQATLFWTWFGDRDARIVWFVGFLSFAVLLQVAGVAWGMRISEESMPFMLLLDLDLIIHSFEVSLITWASLALVCVAAGLLKRRRTAE